MKTSIKKVKDRALQFEKEYKHAHKTKYLKALDPYITYFPLLFGNFEGTMASKHLLIGLTASMEGITKGENNPLGLFSPDFERMCSLVARGLMKCKPASENTEIESRLLTKLIMGGLTALTGMLAVATENVRDEEDPTVNLNFFNELMLRVVFSSELPKSLLKSMAESIGLEEGESALSAYSLDSLAIMFTLLNYVKKGSEQNSLLIEAMKERLLKNFEAINSALNDYILADKLTREEAQPLRLFITQGKMMLNSKNYEQLLKDLKALAKPYNISLTNIEEDQREMGRLFLSLGTNFAQSKQANDNVIHFAG